MFKVVLTVKKRAGMTRQQFIDYYEQNHTALVLRTVPNAPLYRRNFIVDGAEVGGIQGSGTGDAGFDCMTEIGFHSREECEAHIAAYLDPANHPLIAADEAKFIAPDGLRFYIMEVHQTSDLVPA